VSQLNGRNRRRKNESIRKAEGDGSETASACKETIDYLVDERHVEPLQLRHVVGREDAVVDNQFVYHGDHSTFATIKKSKSSGEEINGSAKARERGGDLRQMHRTHHSRSDIENGKSRWKCC